MPFISDDDEPATEKNIGIMSTYKGQLEAFYYDPSKYDTYLEQLGIDYPQLTNPDAEETFHEGTNVHGINRFSIATFRTAMTFAVNAAGRVNIVGIGGELRRIARAAIRIFDHGGSRGEL